MDINRKLRLLRDEMNWNQDVVAEKLKCNRATVSNYENGRLITNDVLLMYCNIFNVSADWLLGLTSDRKRGGSDLMRQLDRLAALVAAQHGKPLSPDQLEALLSQLIAYYQRGAPAGNAPMDALAAYVAALTVAVQAAGGPIPQLLVSVNDAAKAGLSVTSVMEEFLRHKAAPED